MSVFTYTHAERGICCTTTKNSDLGLALLDNDAVNKKVSQSIGASHWVRFLFSCALASLTMVLTPSAHAQAQQNAKTSKAPQKVIIQSSTQRGFKDNSANKGAKSNSLNPALFQRKDPDELMLDSAGNLDYRVSQGCLRRNFNEDNLPESVGIDNRAFSDFFKTQTKTFFDRMRGDCIPYAVAFGSRNRFDSLSIMNGPVQDARLLPHPPLVDFWCSKII